MLTLDVQRESAEEAPDDEDLRRAAELALASAGANTSSEWELSLRIVDTDEMQALNNRYRGKHGTTNVLSFPVQLPEGISVPLLGDVVICAPVVREEATLQHKPEAAHWDHMLVHGVLHLLGFDHQTDDEATAMESLETTVLQQLGWPCPYERQDGNQPPATEASARVL